MKSAISGKNTELIDDLVPYKFLGDSSLNIHDYKKAIIYYNKSLVQKPEDIQALQFLTYCYFAIGKFSDALKYAEIIINKYPNSYIGYQRKAVILGYDNPEQAIEFLEIALKLTESLPQDRISVLTSLVNLYLILKDWPNRSPIVKKL